MLGVKNFAILRFEKVKSSGELAGRSKHNRREGELQAHIDKERIPLNVISGDAVEAFKKLTAGKKMRKNGVLAVEAVLGFSREEGFTAVEWGAAAVEWMHKRFGKENILEVALHLDEETPHMHVLFVPRDKKGKWNWNGICNGKRGLRDLQTSYAESMRPFGLVRGEASERKHAPPSMKRELDSLQKEVEKIPEIVEKAEMEKEKKTLDLVKAYLGEKRFLDFLEWAKRRKEEARKAKELREKFMSPQ